jgi:hypothetical protein
MNKDIIRWHVADKNLICRKQSRFRKITANVKGKEKIESFYPTISEAYFKYFINHNGNQIVEFSNKLIDYVYEDNIGILSKKECVHIGRFYWNNKGDNI